MPMLLQAQPRQNNLQVFLNGKRLADAQKRIRDFAASLEQKVEERTRELTAAAAEI